MLNATRSPLQHMRGENGVLPRYESSFSVHDEQIVARSELSSVIPFFSRLNRLLALCTVEAQSMDAVVE